MLSTEEFEDGFKPYLESTDYIWEMRFEINTSDITRSDWDKMRREMESDLSTNLGKYYESRTRSDDVAGPYGILVCELRTEGVLE